MDNRTCIQERILDHDPVDQPDCHGLGELYDQCDEFNAGLGDLESPKEERVFPSLTVQDPGRLPHPVTEFLAEQEAGESELESEPEYEFEPEPEPDIDDEFEFEPEPEPEEFRDPDEDTGLTPDEYDELSEYEKCAIQSESIGYGFCENYRGINRMYRAL